MLNAHLNNQYLNIHIFEADGLPIGPLHSNVMYFSVNGNTSKLIGGPAPVLCDGAVGTSTDRAPAAVQQQSEEESLLCVDGAYTSVILYLAG